MATVGGVNKLSQQTKYTRQSCSGVDYSKWQGFVFFRVFVFLKKRDLINESVTTVMFVGIKGGWEV